jgi:hypothetical protein
VNRREIYREWNNKGAPNVGNISLLPLAKIVIDRSDMEYNIGQENKKIWLVQWPAMATVFDTFFFINSAMRLYNGSSA